jgi:hypothetical protein
MLGTWEKAVVDDAIAKVESQPADPRAKLQQLFELAPSVDFSVELALRDVVHRQLLHRRGARWEDPLPGAATRDRSIAQQIVGLSRREHPVLLYDGDCAFCTSCARGLQRLEPDAEITPWQLTDLTALGVTEEQAAAAVQWVGVDSTVRSGHHHRLHGEKHYELRTLRTI